MTMGKACHYCLPNITNQLHASRQCVTGNGVERAVLTLNRMIPGPSIQVIQHRTCCNQSNLPTATYGVNRCTHVVNIALGSLVEIVAVDLTLGGALYHPLHLHAYQYYFIGMGSNPDPVTCPDFNATVFQILDKKGYWLLHCHFDYHMINGMQMILHVGERKDLPPIPPKFPKCGNYKPLIKHMH